MTETTNDQNLLNTLVCLERQQLDMIPEEIDWAQKKTVKQVRPRLPGRQDHIPEDSPDHNNQPAT